MPGSRNSMGKAMATRELTEHLGNMGALSEDQEKKSWRVVAVEKKGCTATGIQAVGFPRF